MIINLINDVHLVNEIMLVIRHSKAEVRHGSRTRSRISWNSCDL